jgi:sugar lactone lactonase YvrE
MTTSITTPDFEVLDSPVTELGEGPMWSAAEGALYWIDIVGRRILRYVAARRAVEVREVPYAPSAVIPRSSGGLLLVTKKGMALMDFESGEVRSIPVDLVDFTQEVFNDAKCDSAGRLWVGTRDLHGSEPKGSLFCLAPDYTMTRHTRGIVVSNGLGWSPDERTFYHVDTRPGRIDAYDYDVAAGTLSNRRTFVDYAGHGAARPDGCAVDAQGGLWVAEVEDWHVRRYGPDGRLTHEIRLPVRKPTSVMFGGPDLDTLYITSMTFRLAPEELPQQPLAGRVLAMDVGFKGLPEHCFGN